MYNSHWNWYRNLLVIWCIICAYERISISITESIQGDSLFPYPCSLFAAAQEEDDYHLQKRAQFILNAGKKRWNLFESSILHHYGARQGQDQNEDVDQGKGKGKRKDAPIANPSDGEMDHCVYYNHPDRDPSRVDSMWYQVCPGKHIRRFIAEPISDSSSTSEPTDDNDNEGRKQGQEIVVIDSKQYRIRNVELMGTYRPNRNGHGQDNQKQDPDHDEYSNANENENAKANEVHFYLDGGRCPQENLGVYATRLEIQDCCDDEVNVDHDDDDYDDDDEDNHNDYDGQMMKMKIIKINKSVTCRLNIQACYKCGAKPEPDATSKSTPQGQSIMDYFLHQSDMQKRASQTINTAATPQPTNLQILQESLLGSFPPMPPSRISHNIKSIKSMFQHAYDSYMYNAYPHSELKPISCKPGLFDLVRLPALTLIDSLDMLLILQNHTEFARSVERLRNLDVSMRHLQRSGSSSFILDNPMERGGIFTVDQNVSVFETNIRVLGGLLSAHQMAEVWMDRSVLVDDVFYDENRSVIGVDVGKARGERVVNGDVDRDTYVNKGEDEDRHASMSMCIDEDGQSRICSQSEAGDPLESTSNSNHNQNRNRSGNRGSEAKKLNSTEYWNYDGFLLELAHDIGRRLLPAFKTDTGIPYGTVNLLYGIPPSETTIASLAGGGTLSLEMELLSRLTGDQTFGKVAKLSTRALFGRRSQLDLLGKHIDVKSGSWTETLSGIGSNSDSIYEYLIKHHALFQEDEDFFTMFDVMHSGIYRNGKLGDWYPDVPMSNGLTHPNSVFESLAAFYPGMQILLGELNPAARSTNAFTLAREAVKFLPERFDFSQFEAASNHKTYPLRPELYESNYFLHLATKDLGLGKSTSGWLWNVDFFLHAVEETARTECGYGVVKGVSSKDTKLHLGDEMPSFFLSETLKYFYLTFDDMNPINTDKERNWIFTTEAHPIHSVSPISSKRNKSSNKRGKSAYLEDDWLDNAKSDILESLNDLIKTNNTERGAIRIPSQKQSPGRSWRYLNNEIWTSNTGKFPHIKDLQKSSASQSTKSTSGTSNSFSSWQKGSTGRIIEHPMNVMGESAEGGGAVLNFAVLTHDKNGRGTTLSQSCPNYHQSNSLWIQALAGEELDYVQTFESTLSNDKAPSTMKPRITSSLTASALFGTAYFSTDWNKCKKTKKRKQTDAGDAPGPRTGSQRIDMGGNLGSFDVSIDASGVGYHVKHLRTGESIEVTIVQSNDDEKATNEDIFIAVDSFLATGSSSKVKVGLLNQIKSVFTQNDASIRKKRHVMIADMAGNSYECKVELKYKIDETTDEEADDDQRIAVFPCLPASYGQTSMETLNSANEEGLSFEAAIYKPDTSDPFGCHEDWDNGEDDACNSAALEERSQSIRALEDQLDVYLQDSSKQESNGLKADINELINALLELKTSRDNCIENAQPPRVQLVHRGECSFRGKGINQAERFNAKALIVMNTENRRLFIMAGVLTKSQEMSNTEEPISVLVTKDDGEEIMNIVDRYGVEDKSIIASVRVIPRSAHGQIVKGPDNTKQKMKWPMVITSPGNIQVHSSQGWGVGAVKEKDIWQIMLLENQYKNI